MHESERRDQAEPDGYADASLSDADKRILYELRVHQVELEAQNEELRHVQEQLEVARARYFDLFELAPVAYFTLNEAGVIQEANHTASELLHLPKAKLVRQVLTDFIFSEDQGRYYFHRRQLLETGGRRVVQLRMTPRGGVPIWVRVEEIALIEADGALVRRVVVSDITAQKRAEDVLSASEARHRLLFEKSRDGMMTVAPLLGRFTSGNAAALAMFGARDEQEFATLGFLQCSPSHQLDGSPTNERVAATLEAALREGSCYAEWKFKRLSGEEFLASVLLTRIDIDGQPVLKATIRDETSIKKLQAALSQHDRLTSMGLLAAGVAHEINNPLVSVLYNLETLTEDLPRLGAAVEPGRLRDLVDSARDALASAQRIKTISRTIGAFSRAEGSERMRVDVNRAIDCATTMALNDIRFRARLILDLKEVPHVWASEGKLSQIFLNLLINAAQAFGNDDVERNQIRIRTWAESDDVLAEVEDTASGIPSDMVGRIFEPFFTTKPVGMGSGLGLSICRDILAEFGGDIRVTSELGRGTRFRVRLPINRGASIPPDSTAAEIPQPVQRLRILVVDDEPAICSMISRTLGKKHEVVTAPSAQAARSILDEDTAFDVVLCDLMMPGMTGMDLHEWLVTRDEALARRIVFMTGGAFTPKASDFLSHMTVATLEKPFDSAKLEQAISSVVATH